VFPQGNIKSGGESKLEQYPVVYVPNESTPQRSGQGRARGAAAFFPGLNTPGNYYSRRGGAAGRHVTVQSLLYSKQESSFLLKMNIMGRKVLSTVRCTQQLAPRLEEVGLVAGTPGAAGSGRRGGGDDGAATTNLETPCEGGEGDANVPTMLTVPTLKKETPAPCTPAKKRRTRARPSGGGGGGGGGDNGGGAPADTDPPLHLHIAAHWKATSTGRTRGFKMSPLWRRGRRGERRGVLTKGSVVNV
jgi:hypothetical protein